MAEITQIEHDILIIQGFLQYPSCTIRADRVYKVYDRHGFLDPQHDSPESAIEALELRKYELTEKVVTHPITGSKHTN